MKMLFRFFVMLLFAVACLPAQAQETPDTALYKLETQDGNVFFGTIIERTTEEVRLQTDKLGIITFPIREISSIKAIDQNRVRNGEVWEDSPLGARYFYAPNGYGLKRGEAYYQNVWVLLNQLSYGITDHISLGVGTVPLFLFNGTPTPVWITPKVSIPIVKNKFNLGVGALVGTLLGDLQTFGIVYGVGTLGSRDRNVTVGVGYGYAEGDWAQRPAITLSGQYRVSKRTYLVSENYLFSGQFDSQVVLGLGGRTSWEKVSLDYALIIPTGDFFIAVPWLGVGIPFGR